MGLILGLLRFSSEVGYYTPVTPPVTPPSPDFSLLLARTFPELSVLGIDDNPAAIAHAREVGRLRLEPPTSRPGHPATH